MADSDSSEMKKGVFAEAVEEIFSSPLYIFLCGVIAFLVFKIYKTYTHQPIEYPEEKVLTKMKKRDFTVEELKKYDGHGEDGRILVAVNGKVFDVTQGKRFYGPGGPYSAFGGRDASRGLATFSVTGGKDEYDDLSDLNTMEMDSVREWEMQYSEKYDYVGKLLKPGQQPTNYSDEEEDTSQDTPHQEPLPKSKDD